MAQSGEGKHRVLTVGPEVMATPVGPGVAAWPLRYGGVRPMGAEPSCVRGPSFVASPSHVARAHVARAASSRRSFGEVS